MNQVPRKCEMRGLYVSHDDLKAFPRERESDSAGRKNKDLEV